MKCHIFIAYLFILSSYSGPRLINRTDPLTGLIERAAVEKIMAKRMNPRKKDNEYLVKWESKPQTWEPSTHLDTCKDLIDNFEVLLAKQKEMRAKTQLAQNQPASVVAQPQATSTPTAVAAVVTNRRPVRFSKEKAINNVKQWTGGNKQEEAAEAPGKRKLEEEEDFEEDNDDIDDEDYELESSWEKKKMAQQLGQTSVKRIKTEVVPSQNGNVRVLNKASSDMQIGATVVRRVIGGAKSPDAIIAGQKQQSGVFKKASPGQVVARKPGEGQVRIVGSNQQIKSGIVRVAPGQAPPKSNVVTRVVSKVNTPNRQQGTGTVVRSVQQVQSQQKTLAQKIIQRSPIAKTAQSPAATRVGAQVVAKQPIKSPQQTTVVRKAGVQQQVVTRRAAPVQTRVAKKSAHDEEDDGVPDPFPKDLPPIEGETESPPPPLTLCPITGKVLSEGEIAAAAAEAQENADGETDASHQITQILSNEDGSPIYITGDDGTMYQVAGKNATGETILVSTNAEGEQTCVLLPADQDLLAGLPGIQTTDATEAAVDGGMSVEAAVAEAVGAIADESATTTATEGGEQTADENSQEGSDAATQPLSVAIGGEGAESQDGQITAEIVQADEPSPGE